MSHPTRDSDRAAVTLDATAPLVEPRGLAARWEELQAGGVDAVLATVASIEDCRTTVGRLGAWHETARGGLPVTLATTVAEVRAAAADSRLAVVLHLQGSDPIEGDLGLADAYYALGVRAVQLTYNYRTRAGDGCLESVDGGLSDFGRRLVRRLEELRVVVDVSHGGARTTLEAVEAAGGPVVATHANARGLHDHPRNLTDEAARAIADSGGVIGLCAFPAFLTDGEATVQHLLNHAEYLAELVGVEHVGLGLDFAEEDEDDFVFYGYDPRWYPKPPWVYPEGLRSFRDVPGVGDGLRARGFSEQDVDGVLGENFLRVFARIWGA